MSRPKIVQLLHHGKILTGKSFRWFVETWNWLVQGWDNLKGDKDTDPENGIVYIDRTDAEHPVIRLDYERLPRGGGESVPGGAVAALPGCFEWRKTTSNGQDAWTVDNPYYQGGGRIFTAPNYTTTTPVSGFLYLQVPATISSNTAQYIVASSLNALINAGENMQFFILPLYKLTGGEIDIDLRNMPKLPMFEF